MKIVIANKYYFYTGGPERYMAAASDLLSGRGDSVIPFALKLSQNPPSSWSDYFVSPPAGPDQYKLEQFRLSWLQKGKLVMRAIWSLEAYRKMRALIRKSGADLLYLLNICNYLSPSLIDAARREGIPVVMRLSDFNFVCASYRFLREGRVCTECLDKRTFSPALRYCCVEGSLLQTTGRVVPMTVHKWANVLEKVDAFVAPSTTMAEGLIRFGCDAARVHLVPSFVDPQEFCPAEDGHRGYVLYAGRLDPDKGVHLLLEAWSLLGDDAPPLRIAGTGTAAEQLQAEAQRRGFSADTIQFTGQLDKPALLDILRHAAFVVAPSLWMDNAPMSVYESLACGKPVVASDIGGLRDQIDHGETGLRFPPGDTAALAACVQQLVAEPQWLQTMSRNARTVALTRFSPAAHLEKLGAIFDTVLTATHKTEPI